MSQISDLVKTLKAYLKAKRITYKNLSSEIGLSETTVKRMFANQTFSLKRVEEICQIAGLEFFDLVLMAKKNSPKKRSILLLEQEATLAEDSSLFIYFILLLNGWLPASIVEHYEFTKAESYQTLVKLDRLGLIELFEGDRFRLLVSNNINWQKNGPLWNLYRQDVLDVLLSHPFDSTDDRLVISPAHLSPVSIKSILNKIDDLVVYYSELAELDASLPMESRSSVAFVAMFRPWIISGIRNMKRKRK